MSIEGLVKMSKSLCFGTELAKVKRSHPNDIEYKFLCLDLKLNETACSWRRLGWGHNLVLSRCWFQKALSCHHWRWPDWWGYHERMGWSLQTFVVIWCTENTVRRALLLRVSTTFISQWIKSKEAYFTQCIFCSNFMVKIVSQVLLPDLKPHCASERFHSETVMTLLRKTHAKIFPAMERSEMPLYFPQSALFSLFLYRKKI